MKTFCVSIASLALVGCGTTHNVVQQAKIAIPIKCKAAVPGRPIMPTEAMPPNIPKNKIVDAFVAAAQAEIEVREGYETELRAALKSCL